MTIIDIETAPIAGAESQFDPDNCGVPKNLKDPVKIEEEKEKRRLKFIDNLALSPMTGRIIALGIREKGRSRIMVAASPSREKALIREAIRLMGKQFAGHNFEEFDLPFIVTRARMLGLHKLVNYHTFKSNCLDTWIASTCGKKFYDTNMFPESNLSYMANQFQKGSKLRLKECDRKDFASHILSSDPEKKAMARNHLKADLIECESLAKICFPWKFDQWTRETIKNESITGDNPPILDYSK